MFTLEEFVERVITPAVLQMAGLPDTADGRRALDVLIEALLSSDEPV